jgi:hypothetical protein
LTISSVLLMIALGAVPRLAPDAVAIGVAAVVILLAGNLRGVRQAGALFVPVLILICQTIDRHYRSVNEALTLHPLPDHHPLRRRVVPLGPEDEESPEQIVNLIVVPVARLHLASLRALAYAASFEVPILVIHIAPDEEEAEAFRRRWQEWGDHLRLETIVSPYRALVPPLAHYLTALRSQRPELTLTVVLYELVVKHRWHRLLHVQLAARLRRALQQLSDVVITSVPYHLPS